MLLILFVMSMVIRVWSCPTSCSCKWKGGKQTVECINKSLITIPQGIDQGTQVLEFSGNNLDRLIRERFQKLGLINLQKIFMQRCRIRHIEDRSFRGLTNLVELDLSDNIISSVPTESFYDCTTLMRLNLNGNPIKALKAGAFQPLSYLTTLDLSMCEISLVEDGAFTGLNNLEWLKLDNNKITHITGTNILPENLHGVDLHHNPWQCDCTLLDLRTWLINYHVPQSIEPSCSYPIRFKGKVIKELAVNDFACMPEVSPTTLYLEIGEGRNVSLMCRVSAIPEAKVSWWFQGNTLHNDSTIAPGLHLYYFIEEGTVEKTSELFIFNTNADDNGTFACVAENPAGKSLSNYTIRIILREEPIISVTVFPYEYMLIISTTLSVFVLLFIICFALCIVQFKKQRRRTKKKERGKNATIQAAESGDKAQPPRDTEHMAMFAPNRVTLSHKVNGAVINKNDHEMMVYTTEVGNQGPQQMFANTPAHIFQEKNPDLISDTGKEFKKIDDPVEGISWTAPGREYFPVTGDVHLSPSKFIGPDGYPIDYGLPKIPGHYSVVMTSATFYRTLPHTNRSAKPSVRFSREAEFLNKPPYEPYPREVRFTAEGYPGLAPPLFPPYQDPFLSPPAPYKTPEPLVETEWTQSSVAPTTEEPSKDLKDPSNVLKESPDEGYEGESNENGDI